MGSHRGVGALLVALGVGGAKQIGLRERHAGWDVADHRVVSGRLVGHHVGHHAAANQLGQHLGCVAEQANGDRIAGLCRLLHPGQRLVEAVGPAVKVAGRNAPLDVLLANLHCQAARTGHRRGQRLRATHAAKTGRQHPPVGQVATEVHLARCREGLEGTLHDALRADVDPGASGHLAEHGQTGPLEFVELLPGRPVRHQVGVGDEHLRRHLVRPQNADRLARLHQQRLVVLERPERGNDAVKGRPVARSLARTPIDNQVLRPLGHVGVEVVHQHAEGRLLHPTFA